MQPTPAFSPGKSHGQRSLAGYSPWVLQSQTQLSNQKQQNKVLYIYIFNSFLFYFTCVVLDNLKMKLKNGILIQYNIVYLFYYCYHNYYYCIYPLLLLLYIPFIVELQRAVSTGYQTSARPVSSHLYPVFVSEETKSPN